MQTCVFLFFLFPLVPKSHSSFAAALPPFPGIRFAFILPFLFEDNVMIYFICLIIIIYILYYFNNIIYNKKYYFCPFCCHFCKKYNPTYTYNHSQTKKEAETISASSPGQLPIPARDIQIRRKKIYVRKKSFPRHVLRGLEPRTIREGLLCR